MELQDTAVSIHPYFKISPTNLDDFKYLADDLIETTRGEMGCLCYGFSFANDEAFCRQTYKNADSALAHLSNVEDLLEKLIEIAELSRLEIHGSKQELSKLQYPLKRLSPKYFVLEGGFRN